MEIIRPPGDFSRIEVNASPTVWPIRRLAKSDRMCAVIESPKLSSMGMSFISTVFLVDGLHS